MERNDTLTADILKKIKKIEIRSKQLVNDVISGSYNSIFKGYGIEFEEVREYTQGDDYRSIDWNVSARHAKPYVKRFKEERQLNVLLLIDVSGSIMFGSKDSTKNEKLVETAAVLAFTALSNQDKIGAVFFTDEIEKTIRISKNKNTILRLIREIIFAKAMQKKTDINNVLDYAIKIMIKKGIIFILSDFYSDFNLNKIYFASKKHDIIPVFFTDNFEDYPVNVGLVEMLDNETGELKLVDTSSLLYKKFIDERKAKKDKIINEFKKFNIEPMIISTEDDIEKIIFTYFKKRLKKSKL